MNTSAVAPAPTIVTVDIVDSETGAALVGVGNHTGRVVREGRRFLVEDHDLETVVAESNTYKSAATRYARYLGITGPLDVQVATERNPYN